MAQIIPVQALVTKTGTFTGASVAVDNTVVPAGTNWTLCLEVQASGSSDATYRFEFDDSVNAFVASIPGPTFSSPGGIVNKNSKKWSIRKEDFPDLRIGSANAVLRLALTNLQGTTQSVTYQAWLEY